MLATETVYSAFTTTESILCNDSSIWSQAPSLSFSEASSRISRPCEFLWPAGSDLLLPSDLARPREARLSAIKFALPPHSKSLSTLTSTFENLAWPFAFISPYANFVLCWNAKQFPVELAHPPRFLDTSNPKQKIYILQYAKAII